MNKIIHLLLKMILYSKRVGRVYIMQLYECSLLFFIDKFGLNGLSRLVIQQLYSWSYALRLTINSVYPQTINKYAKVQHDERVNSRMYMFSKLSEMLELEGLKLLEHNKLDIDDNNKEKYNAIYKLICERNRY